MNYCTHCGFKIEGEFNFCPNCGSKLEAEIYISDKSQDSTSSLNICRNCGEANAIENSVCFSCGVSLTGKKQIGKGQPESNVNKQTVRIAKSNSSVGNENENEKTLDNKKIIIISVAIIVIFIIALITSNVFNNVVETSTSEINNQTSNSSVNLANLEEINQLQEKVDANPEDYESVLHLAHMQQDAGMSEKAIGNYKKYLVKYPENADARVDMAICFYNLSDYNTAISEMEKAIKYQPDHQIAYLNLGIVNLAAKNIEESKKWFNKTVELDPNSQAGKRAKELLHSH